MKRRYVAIALSILVSSCAASEDGKSRAPRAAPDPVAAADTFDAMAAAAQDLVVPSIASAQLIQDCPDPQSESSLPSPVKRAAKAKSKADSAGEFVQPCSQSSVQLAFTGQLATPTKVTLEEVRLLTSDAKPLATLAPRMPSLWKDGVYEAWDGLLPAAPDQKVSYKLSIPNWAEVEEKLGGGSFGPMYVLEIDVEIAGTTTTLRSPEFERGRAEIVKT